MFSIQRGGWRTGSSEQGIAGWTPEAEGQGNMNNYKLLAPSEVPCAWVLPGISKFWRNMQPNDKKTTFTKVSGRVQLIILTA
jgi:hypothetical protein